MVSQSRSRATTDNKLPVRVAVSVVPDCCTGKPVVANEEAD